MVRSCGTWWDRDEDNTTFEKYDLFVIARCEGKLWRGCVGSPIYGVCYVCEGWGNDRLTTWYCGGRFWSPCDVLMSLYHLVDRCLVSSTEEPTQTCKGQSQWGNSWRNQSFEIGWPHRMVPWRCITNLLFPIRGMSLSLWSRFHSAKLAILTSVIHNQLVRAHHSTMVRVYS